MKSFSGLQTVGSFGVALKIGVNDWFKALGLSFILNNPNAQDLTKFGTGFDSIITSCTVPQEASGPVALLLTSLCGYSIERS